MEGTHYPTNGAEMLLVHTSDLTTAPDPQLFALSRRSSTAVR
jgi:hypothetical protein